MWSDSESELDLLNVQHLVAAIEATVRAEHLLPVTVGVFGDWGSGKSTVMNLAREALDKDPDVICVHFNGWLFEGYEDAKAAILSTILDRLNEKEGLSNEAKLKIGKLVERVNWFRLAGLLGSAAMISHGLPPEATMLAAGLQAAPKMQKIVKEASDRRDVIGRTIRDFEKDFRGLLKTTGIRSVVVFIDDLDRCIPTTIMSTLEAIRLFIFVPGMAFVIAADERLIRRAVRQQFPDVTEAEPEVPSNYPSSDLGREYLEKLVQVPIHIPPLSKAEVATYVNLLFAQLHLGKEFPSCCDKVRQKMATSVGTEVVFSLQTAEDYIGQEPIQDLADDLSLAGQVGDVLSASVHGNPRQTKRFLNTLLLRFQMAKARGVELDRRLAAKLMLLEYFKPMLFQSLGAWQAYQGGRPDEVRQLETWLDQQPGSANAAIDNASGGAGRGSIEKRAGRSGDGPEKDNQDDVQLPLELEAWIADQWVRQWLNVEPPLSGTSLTPYFFFARERTSSISQIISELSPAANDVLQKLLVPSELSHRTAIATGKNLSPVEAGSVFDTLARHTTMFGGMDDRDSALAGLIRFVGVRPELQGQLVPHVRSLPLSSIGAWVPALLASTLTDHRHHPAREAIFTRWKNGGGMLGRATEMAERALKATG